MTLHTQGPVHKYIGHNTQSCTSILCLAAPSSVNGTPYSSSIKEGPLLYVCYGIYTEMDIKITNLCALEMSADLQILSLILFCFFFLFCVFRPFVSLSVTNFSVCVCVCFQAHLSSLRQLALYHPSPHSSN